jgi:4-carboxymuconolactone decarboxylase
VHLPLALTNGVSQEVIDALAEGRRPDGMAGDEEIAYALCEELSRTKGVCDTTYRCAVEKFGEAGVIDMLGVIGYFTTISMVLNVAHTPPAGEGVSPLAPLPL